MKKKILSSLLSAVLLCGAVSTFVACKDYDDDINAVKSDVTTLKSELTSLKSSLESELQTVKSQLQTALDTKADKTEVAALTQRVAALETKIATTDAAIANLQGDVAAAQTALNALTGRVGTTEETLAALKKNLDDQVAALTAWQAELQKWMDAVDAAEYQKQIDALKTDVNGLKEELKKYATADDLNALKTKVNALEGQLGAVSVLEVLVNKMLTSISLLPALYVNGIEAIEFLSIEYIPVVGGTSGYKAVAGASKVVIDNGETEATYALSPSTVKRESLDEDKIAFKTAVAETRAANKYVSDVVKFNGISEFKDGLMTVKLKKANTGSLNRTDGKVNIVSLMVPRKADGKQEYAEVYSENSMLIEKYYTPQISDKSKALTAHGTYAGTAHFSDSATIYNSYAGATPTELVAKSVNYNEPFDLRELVNICLNRTGYHDTQRDIDNATRECDKSKLMTIEEINKYGIAVRFDIPETPYTKDVDNSTNQQDFAKLDGSVITSKTPVTGTQNNRAVVGKEPIVRVDLVDTVNNKLVDQRYLKIKWTEKTMEPKPLETFKDSAELGCNNVKAVIEWKDFIEKIYAVAEENGLSEDNFELIYPIANYEVKFVSAKSITKNGEKAGNVLTSENGTGLPVFGKGSVEADANIGEWILTPDQIETVYYGDKDDVKVFVACVTMKSANPTEYPDLYFNWEFKITLPELPALVGHYEQYWKTPMTDETEGLLVSDESKDIYYLLPVQYKSPQQTGANGYPYCVYDNNLINAFTFDKDGKFIKNLGTCSTWDVQFSKVNYISKNEKGETVATYDPKYTGLEPDQKAGINYTTFGAYQLWRNELSPVASNKALQLNWPEEHTSWCGKSPVHAAANLFIDHFTTPAYDLINPLNGKDMEKTPGLGREVPKFTSEKLVRVSVWSTINGYNYVPVRKYNVAIVAPLCIEAELDSIFEDGVINGSRIDCSKAFKMRDFRGYLVAETTPAKALDYEMWAADLYKYYEIGDITWNTDKVKYAYELKNGSVVINNELEYKDAMTQDDLRKHTNGGINLSIKLEGNELVFYNNGGSNITDMVYAYIPCSVTYGFGVVTTYVKVEIHGTSQLAVKKK